MDPSSPLRDDGVTIACARCGQPFVPSTLMGMFYPLHLVFLAVDQVSKLVAAGLDLRWYVHNPKPHAGWWIPLAMALAVCLLPGRRFFLPIRGDP